MSHVIIAPLMLPMIDLDWGPQTGGSGHSCRGARGGVVMQQTSVLYLLGARRLAAHAMSAPATFLRRGPGSLPFSQNLSLITPNAALGAVAHRSQIDTRIPTTPAPARIFAYRSPGSDGLPPPRPTPPRASPARSRARFPLASRVGMESDATVPGVSGSVTSERGRRERHGVRPALA